MAKTGTRFPVAVCGVRRAAGRGTEPNFAGRRGKAKGARLSGQSKLLIAVHGLFLLANSLSGTFVNVYLWKAKQDLALLGWYALAGHLAGAATFFLAGRRVKERNKMNVLRLGVFVSAVFYLAVLLLDDRAVRYAAGLGALLGIAGGLFWLAYNVVYFEVTGPRDRDRYNGVSGVLGSLSGMFAPWASGLVIAATGGGRTGYRIIFSLSLAIFLIGAVLSFFLKKRKVTGTYDWGYGFRLLRQKGNAWRPVMAGLVAQGVREGVFAFILGVLVFIATGRESKVGNYALVTSAAGALAYWLFGKWLKPRRRSPAMLAGAGLMAAAVFLFFLRVDYATLVAFGVASGIAYPLYAIPVTSSVFDLIGMSRESAEHRVELVVLRELGLNAGRVIGVSLYLAVVSVVDSTASIVWLMLAVGSSPLAAWWCLRGIHTARFAQNQ